MSQTIIACRFPHFVVVEFLRHWRCTWVAKAISTPVNQNIQESRVFRMSESTRRTGLPCLPALHRRTTPRTSPHTSCTGDTAADQQSRLHQSPTSSRLRSSSPSSWNSSQPMPPCHGTMHRAQKNSVWQCGHPATTIAPSPSSSAKRLTEQSLNGQQSLCLLTASVVWRPGGPPVR